MLWTGWLIAISPVMNTLLAVAVELWQSARIACQQVQIKDHRIVLNDMLDLNRATAMLKSFPLCRRRTVCIW